MAVALITGAAGLVGSEAVRLFAANGYDVVGIDNDMRQYFFGDNGSTRRTRERLELDISRYRHVDADIRDDTALSRVFSTYGASISVVIHAAAQPSHDWASREPLTDFTINANGTLLLLERTRQHCPDAAFLFMSTNKVYGDTPNRLPLIEGERRWSVDPTHPYGIHGIDEAMSIDRSLHSLFGVSKTAADLLVQEYGRTFGLKTMCFRAGCLTGPGHASTELHGFLSYLVRSAVCESAYTVFGYKGKQVRDNIDARDLVSALWHASQAPRSAEVYNIGGGPGCTCSMLEAIAIVERLTQRPLRWSYTDRARLGDHIWWISDIRKFRAHYPQWTVTCAIEPLIAEIHEEMRHRLLPAGRR